MAISFIQTYLEQDAKRTEARLQPDRRPLSSSARMANAMFDVKIEAPKFMELGCLDDTSNFQDCSAVGHGRLPFRGALSTWRQADLLFRRAEKGGERWLASIA
jgi:hypothetical protein